MYYVIFVFNYFKINLCNTWIKDNMCIVIKSEEV